ncbi:MAG: AmmeMemoRadiSam system radical SAM enzyme [Armatimonadota bacterium]
MTRRQFLCTGLRAGAAAAGLAACPRAARAKVGDVSNHEALFWKPLNGTDLQCQLCPRRCRVKAGERGFCGSRENIDGKYVARVYGKPCVAFVDPVEKDPFFHFLPSQKTLAIGTASCNLDCRYCQSYAFAQARPEETDNKDLPPQRLVAEAKRLGLKLITFTYSEPIQAIEYVMDTAALAKGHGIKTTVHTAAYIEPGPLLQMCRDLAAVNIDLKGMSEDFYRDVTGGQLAPVLSAIETVRNLDVWLELTNLVVPGHNDSPAMVKKMAAWIRDNVGRDTPLHLSVFFPTYKMLSVPHTPKETLRDLRKVAYDEGLRYVYVGNVPGDPAESTYCPKCRAKVVKRIGYSQTSNTGLDINNSACARCRAKIAGKWH